MFTILAKACAVGVCTIVFGPVDWSKPHSADLIWVAGHEVLIGQVFAGATADDEDQARSGLVIKQLVGARPLICKGEFGNHNTFIKAECYFLGERGAVVNIAEEMHKRGFTD